MTNRASDYFRDHIRKDGEHWIWTGPQYRNYAGYFYAEGRRFVTRRYAYEQANGELPSDARVQLLCGETGCVNPAHLSTARRHEGRELKFPRHGVSLHTSGGWLAMVGLNYVGYFRDEDLAYRAVVAYRRLHGLMNEKYERLAEQVEEDGKGPAEVLRHASSTNMRAKRSATFRRLGVSWCGQTNRWQAKTVYANVVRHLGRYDEELDAYEAALDALIEQGAPPKRTQPLQDAIDSLRAARYREAAVESNADERRETVEWLRAKTAA